MTTRDVDVEYDFDPDDGWFGQALPIATRTPVAASPPVATALPDPEPRPVETATATATDHQHQQWHDAEADTDRWFVEDLHRGLTDDFAPEPATPEPQRPTFRDAPAPRSWESSRSRSGAWDFQPVAAASPRRYSGRMLTAGVGAVAVIAGVLLAVFLLDSPDPRVEDTGVTPTEPSAEPTLTSAVPTPSASQVPLPPPPAPPPPAPPPPVEQDSPPVTRQYTPPQRQSSSEPDKPQIGVTRTPNTRYPISATPPPPPPSERNSSTPGDNPHRQGGFHF